MSRRHITSTRGSRLDGRTIRHPGYAVSLRIRKRIGQRIAPGFWPALLAELARHQGSWFDVCSFPRLRADCLGDPALGQPCDTAPLLRLASYADFDAYLAARSPKLRETIRRRLRRMAEAGQVDFRVHGPAETAEVLAWLPRLEEERRRRWQTGGCRRAILRHWCARRCPRA